MGRKTTEEEEGEIVSDPSDSEGRRGEKRSRRYSSISNPDVEEKPKAEDLKGKGGNKAMVVLNPSVNNCIYNISS